MSALLNDAAPGAANQQSVKSPPASATTPAAPQSSGAQPTALQDDLTLLKPPPLVPEMKLPEAGSHVYIWGGVILALLVVGTVIYRVGKRTNWTFRKPESPQKRALRELSAWQSLNDDAQLREAVAGISATLRRYLHGQFKLPADQMTSEEFWVKQQAEGLIPEQYENFWVEFLPPTDRIKYAGQAVARKQFRDLLEGAKEYVNRSAVAQTTPKEQSRFVPQEVA
jgi:hypothetical protein